jgi:MFS family permease
LLVIFLTIFIDLLGFGIVLPLLPLYADQFVVDPNGWIIGMLMAVFSIMQFIFAPFWGSLSDRIGRRPVILIGLTGSVVFYALFGVAAIYQSLTWLFVSRIGAGVFGATIPTAQAYIADTTDFQNRVRGMALIGIAFGLGFTLGPLLALFALPADATGEVSTSQSPGPGPGWVAASLSLIALILAVFLLPESRRFGTSPSHASGEWWNTMRWKQALSRSGVTCLLIAIFVCIFSFANFETTLSMLIKGSDHFVDAPFEFSFRNVCLTFAAIGAVVAVVQGGIVRPLSKIVSEHRLATCGALIEVIGFGLISLASWRQSVPLLFFALVVVVAGYGCLQPTLHSLLSRWTSPEQQGAVLGVGQSVNSLARILGSALGIPLLKASIVLPYIVGSVAMAGVAGLVLFASKRGRDYIDNRDPAGS